MFAYKLNQSVKRVKPFALLVSIILNTTSVSYFSWTPYWWIGTIMFLVLELVFTGIIVSDNKNTDEDDFDKTYMANLSITNCVLSFITSLFMIVPAISHSDLFYSVVGVLYFLLSFFVAYLYNLTIK